MKLTKGINEVEFKKWIFLKALIVRVIVLLIIFFLTPNLSVGFLSDSYSSNDDVRFETGGMYYAENAKSIIDFPTFKQAYGNVGDWIGYKTGSFFSTLALWYWIVCIILYLTKHVIFVRLFNIIIASLSCFVLYNFVNVAYDSRIAMRATRLLMYLPYPVVFSCFAYRDSLIMCLTLYLLFKSSLYQKNGKFQKVSEWIAFVISAIILLLLRSGISIIFIALCFFIMFSNRITKKRIKTRYLIIIPIVLILGIFLVYKFGGQIIYKVNVYIIGNVSSRQEGTIGLLNINGIRDIYKIPFAYLFSVIMPIGLGKGFGSWAEIVGNLNIIMVFIAVGSLLFVFKKEKRNNTVYWSCMAYYLISVIASLGIFRHYYSVLPFAYIAYSEFRQSATKNEKLLMYLLGALYAIALIIFYLR